MKTLKLIKRSWLLVFIYLFLRFIQWCYQNYATNEFLRDCIVVTLFTVAIVIFGFLLRYVTIFIIDYGDYNDFFSKHTDPVIEKIERFFNRRNIEK